MSRNFIIGIIVLLVLVAIVGIGILTVRQGGETGTLTPPEGDPLVVNHEYDGSLHRYSGTLEVPTPCHEVDTVISALESLPEQIMIDIAIQEPSAGVVCVQVIDQKMFEGSIPASSGAQLTRVRIDGEDVDFNVVEE